MSEDPEEMHPDNGGASRLGVEEMSAKIAVDQQHYLRRRKRTDCENYQSRHYQIEPGEQRHFCQRHARATQAKNCCHDVDRRTDAAKT